MHDDDFPDPFADLEEPQPNFILTPGPPDDIFHSLPPPGEDFPDFEGEIERVLRGESWST